MRLKFILSQVVITGLFLFCILSPLKKGFSQEVLLEKDLKSDTLQEKFGPNMAHFFIAYVDCSFLLPIEEADSARLVYGSSYQTSFGVRYKRRITNWEAVGLDLSFSVMRYKLKQDSSKSITPPEFHDFENISLSNIGLEVYNRINYGKRGNFTGNFFDIGAYGNWAYRTEHKIKDKLDDGNPFHAKKAILKNRGLSYVETLNYGLRCRLGFNRYIISASYRLSDLFIESFKLQEFPRLIVGIQLGLHK